MPETRKKLALLKGSERETYGAVIEKLMALVPSRDEEGDYTDAFRIGLLNARLDLHRGRGIPLSDVKKSLGL
ncbi:TPA: hypothetical protein HA318_05605 [Candidatus Micrarchaeota archaeon]|nr:MAG: hypothetical protein AUJ65_00250 [Candidatus Micrarchaeota archaeon CG1_02_51_15]HII39447.1 hypothetical protein [Candidatus Micrarchaeota archaeon]